MRERDVEVVEGPRVETRAETPTLGIRETVPFRTMLSNRDRLLGELIEWLTAHDVEPTGPFFLRLHVVDMAGSMDIEVGVVSAASTTADQRVRAGVIPAGRYALLDYQNTSLPANRMLIRWVSEQGLSFDSHGSSEGDVFAARCEIYVTDPRTERRKTRWVVQLAFLLRDGAP
ncbi:GyrI-like domain-containing protein [Leifsonia poae]|uniref:GyrI-like domain-containing protein n=1 Tax=Leifsonia poae TaxID=110933 RepID=UPI003D668667